MMLVRACACVAHVGVHVAITTAGSLHANEGGNTDHPFHRDLWEYGNSIDGGPLFLFPIPYWLFPVFGRQSTAKDN
jgi:hypothetical protein